MSNELWHEINEMFMGSGRQISINTEQVENGEKANEILQITPNSAMGSIVLNTSGIVVDNWIRILGHDSEKKRGIISWNMFDSNGVAARIDKMLIVADDVIGGIFALNAGKFDTGIGEVWYFAPDTLEWESLEMKYSEFLAWITQGNIDEFYGTMRWSGWRELCRNVKYDEAVLIYPFLWSKEVQIETAEKKIVPVEELFQINQEYCERINLA